MLRHLAGFLTGVALVPVLWGAVSWSADLLPRLADGEVSVATVSAVVLLTLVGVCGAGLVATRVTPVIAGTCGPLLAALALWPAVAPQTMEPALGWLNPENFLYPAGPGLAVALPLGVLLFGSALTPTRWRALNDVPGSTRVVAGMSREQYRSAPVEGTEDLDPGGRGPVGDTVPEPLPAPVPYAPPPVSGSAGDPDKTTTPFRRGETGAVWTPLDDEVTHNRAYRDDRV